MAQSQGIFYKHQSSIVVDYCTKYEYNQPIFPSAISQQTHKMYEQIVIITQIWHRTKFYFTCISNEWYQALYLITVPNMNKINTFIGISCTNTHNLWRMAIITQIWHRAKFYFTCIINPCSLIMVPDMKKIHPPLWRNAQGWTDRLGCIHMYFLIPLLWSGE